jgi:virginiamycin B lyase
MFAGPDGNLWFTENTANKIGRITISGAVTEFPIPTVNSGPFGITAGGDGNLWFIEKANKIGRITTGGVITEFTVPQGGQLREITKGADANLWFTETNGNRIGRIVP